MSSYSSPAPQGDDKATGAYAVAIAAQAGGTNNDGNATDSAGNVKVDFVWGNFPLQPNDERTENQLSNFGGSTGDTAWAQTTYATATRLNLGDISAYSGSNVIANKNIRSIHEITEADYSAFPAYTPGSGKYNITQVSGDGTTVRYEAMNFLKAGDTVDISGVAPFNLTSATVATAKQDYFTVTNATTGELININNGIVQLSNALTAADGAYIAGVPYISVPNVLGLTTALAVDALRDAGYSNGNITTASAATNTRTDVTRFNATSATVAVIYATNAHTNYPTGTKVTLVAGTPAGVSPVNLPAYALGTWTVTGSAGAGQITVSGSGFTVADTTGINATGTLGGANGTIKTQSTAAGAASVALSATITVTPWATAS